MDTICKFTVGQIIHHVLFNYRGVIVDIDSNFQGTETWYREVAKSSPPRNKPWYHVLVDKSYSITYVAERNLEEEISKEPIVHPLIKDFFKEFENGSYKVNFS
tara:strand:+ start:10 stop:318 length:309 start_codon:yes stop_codon:yes gene_type:complete